MKIAYIKYLPVLVLGFILVACGGSDGGGDDTPPVEPPVAIPAPSASALVFPDNNTECNTGQIVSETSSSVTFQWTASQNTDTYEVNIKNLDTDVTAKRTATTNELAVTIARGTPFEWFVISKATGTTETATSPKWLFYNEGAGIENYAPFPANVISPERGANISTANTTINLSWSASDVDNDIVGYEVFMDTSETPTTSIGSTTETTIDATIASGNTYRWVVVTTDSGDNNSTSEVFEFKIN